MSSFSVLFNTSYFTTTTKSPIKICKISSSSYKSRIPSSSGRIFPIKQPKPLTKKLYVETLAARDTIIEFGKHKGKMLGTLPSSYLKWVSKNLRTGDSEYWAKLADEVLDDPVYKDRTEWEFAEKILHGSDESMRKKGEEVNSVSMLLEISERFGWDNQDKIGWSKINFELLGTSKSGRIPRLTDSDQKDETVRKEVKKKEEDDGNEWRREERRERMRREMEKDGGKLENWREQKVNLGKIQDMKKQPEQPRIQSPFPGRESLLKKVMNKRRFQ